MRTFLADLHIHTLLSPCGDLEMTPRMVVEKSLERGLSIIAISDHNSTRMGEIIAAFAATKGLTVLPAVEVNTAEEVHCLAILPDWKRAATFQQFLDNKLIVIKNKPSLFGYQVVVDVDEQVLFTEDRLLVSALKASVKEVETEVHQLNGLFIPAHISRRQNGILHQLGFIPHDLECDAYELTPGSLRENYWELVPNGEHATWIFSSDAHYPEQIGKFSTGFWLEKPSFEELKMALKNEQGRRVEGLVTGSIFCQ
jgi:PHP family Zn ribbon phosphoesterase